MAQQHPNLLLINTFFQAYSNNDSDAIRQILDPDIEWVIPGRHPLSGTKVGVEEVLNYFKQLSVFSFHARPIVPEDQHAIDEFFNKACREMQR
jgi:ketosteroid isomerase-like protein